MVTCLWKTQKYCVRMKPTSTYSEIHRCHRYPSQLNLSQVISNQPCWGNSVHWILSIESTVLPLWYWSSIMKMDQDFSFRLPSPTLHTKLRNRWAENCVTEYKLSSYQHYASFQIHLWDCYCSTKKIRVNIIKSKKHTSVKSLLSVTLWISFSFVSLSLLVYFLVLIQY